MIVDVNPNFSFLKFSRFKEIYRERQEQYFRSNNLLVLNKFLITPTTCLYRIKSIDIDNGTNCTKTVEGKKGILICKNMDMNEMS